MILQVGDPLFSSYHLNRTHLPQTLGGPYMQIWPRPSNFVSILNLQKVSSSKQPRSWISAAILCRWCTFFEVCIMVPTGDEYSTSSARDSSSLREVMSNHNHFRPLRGISSKQYGTKNEAKRPCWPATTISGPRHSHQRRLSLVTS